MQTRAQAPLRPQAEPRLIVNTRALGELRRETFQFGEMFPYELGCLTGGPRCRFLFSFEGRMYGAMDRVDLVLPHHDNLESNDLD